jgi:hypothetical protein
MVPNFHEQYNIDYLLISPLTPYEEKNNNNNFLEKQEHRVQTKSSNCISLARTFRPCARSIPKHLWEKYEIMKKKEKVKHTVRYSVENHEFVEE